MSWFIFIFFFFVLSKRLFVPFFIFHLLQRSNIYRLDMKTGKWNKIEGTLELPASTLFLGELVSELKGEVSSLKSNSSVYA